MSIDSLMNLSCVNAIYQNNTAKNTNTFAYTDNSSCNQLLVTCHAQFSNVIIMHFWLLSTRFQNCWTNASLYFKTIHHHNHYHLHHHWQNIRFRAIAFLRRSCQFASGFYFFGFGSIVFTQRGRETWRIRSLYLCSPVTSWPSYITI